MLYINSWMLKESSVAQSKRRKRIFLFFIYFIATPAGIFYLFVFPALVANQTFPPNKFGIGFAAFLYIQFWMLPAEFAYESAVQIYNLKRKQLFKFLDIPYKPKRSLKRRSFRSIIISCFISYGFTLYGYAIFYTFLSHINVKSFNIGKLGVFDAIYFSLITATTVGFGDIFPTSVIAKLAVMTEIVIGLFYAIFFFSIIAGLLRNKQIGMEATSNKANPSVKPPGEADRR